MFDVKDKFKAGDVVEVAHPHEWKVEGEVVEVTSRFVYVQYVHPKNGVLTETRFYHTGEELWSPLPRGTVSIKLSIKKVAQ